MAAPPLPDIFGNYTLGEDFVEVVPPDAISWLPQTQGWLWLGAIVASLLLRYAWRRLRRWWHNRYRREALAKLHALPPDGDGASWLAELNRLLKLTALAAFPRSEVARLSGEHWVDFLNAQCEQPTFEGSTRQALALGAYTGLSPAASERSALLAACERWVQTHRGRFDA